MVIVNKYKFIYDKDFFITDFYSVIDGEYDYEGQLSQYPTLCDGYTRYRDGEFIVDLDKKAEIEEAKRKQNRIAELKAYLDSTDYIYNSIREGGRTEEYYADVIAKRKEARREIQELEG